MELRHLRYFVVVAEELHFGRAAARLNTSQPSLSQQIRDLEREVNVDLFRRTKRHVELTAAGGRFLHEARRILAAAAHAGGLARETARAESRKIVIGISPETDWRFLGKALRLFAEHVTSVDVLFQNLTPDAQVKALHEGQIDIGFVNLPLDAEGLVAERTGRVRLMIALPENHPVARKRSIRLEELSGEALITTEGGLPSDRTVLGMVAAGLTIALVEPAMRQMDARGVVFRPLASPAVFLEKGFIHRRGDQTAILAALLHEMKEILEESLGRRPSRAHSDNSEKDRAGQG
jgi:DNA-binding transcriptional LysR family regulator